MVFKLPTAEDELHMARNMKFAKVSAIATCSIIVLAITSLVFALTMSPPEELAAVNRENVISQIQ